MIVFHGFITFLLQQVWSWSGTRKLKPCAWCIWGQPKGKLQRQKILATKMMMMIIIIVVIIVINSAAIIIIIIILFFFVLLLLYDAAAVYIDVTNACFNLFIIGFDFIIM